MEEHLTNVKVVVRIRNPANGSVKETPKSPQVIKQQTIKRQTSKSPVKSPLSKKPVSGADNSQLSTINNSKEIFNNNYTALNDNAKYTIFTSIQPSHVIVSSSKPIFGKLIKDTFFTYNEIYDHSVNLLKDTTILEFDSVYNEQYKLDKIYNENVKDNVSNMLKGKNACVLFFGPSDGGKSFTLRGGDNSDKGILDRSAEDLFNLIELSKQVNQGKSIKIINYNVKLCVYQVFNENITDLLNNSQSQNFLKIEKMVDNQNGEIFTKIIDLTERDIRTKKEISTVLNEALKIRKNQAQILKINELKKKSHLVISLILEKIVRTSENYSKTNEKTIEKFSQIDFIEIASAQFGLPKINTENQGGYQSSQELLYKNISQTFNSLCNNIVSAATNSQPKQESKLTLCLKPTLNRNSNIVFVVNVLATESPLSASLKTLKFANWMRNQIINITDNTDTLQPQEVEEPELNINTNYYDKNLYSPKSTNQNFYNDIKSDNYDYTRYSRENDNQRTDSYDRDYSRVRENSLNKDHRRQNSLSNMRIQTEENIDSNYQNTGGKRNVFKQNYHQRGAEFEESKYDTHNYRLKSNYPKENTVQMERNIYKRQINEPLNAASSLDQSFNQLNLNKINELERQIISLTQQNNELTKNFDSLKQYRIRSEESIFLNDTSSDKVKQELSILRSDTIIFKEEINRLSDLNGHYEDELNRQRNRNLELAAENERLLQDKLLKQQELEKLNIELARSKGKESEFQETYTLRFNSENRIKELESDIKNIHNERQKIEVEYKVVSERYNDLKARNDQTESELHFLKLKQNEEINNFESRMEKMSKELEFIQRENNALRTNDERLRQEILNYEKQRDNYRDKYQDYKSKNALLNSKVSEIENEVKSIMMEKQSENIDKKKIEDGKKNKLETKQKLIEEMQNRLMNFKSDFLKQRMMKKNE